MWTKNKVEFWNKHFIGVTFVGIVFFLFSILFATGVQKEAFFYLSGVAVFSGVIFFANGVFSSLEELVLNQGTFQITDEELAYLYNKQREERKQEKRKNGC